MLSGEERGIRQLGSLTEHDCLFRRFARTPSVNISSTDVSRRHERGSAGLDPVRYFDNPSMVYGVFSYAGAILL